MNQATCTLCDLQTVIAQPGDRVRIPHMLTKRNVCEGTVATVFYGEDPTIPMYLVKMDDLLFTTEGFAIEHIVSRNPYVKVIK